ncbi:MAG: acylase, partial [Winogradskyella sp.]|nr:acylase [Winogradskyella sp.]
LAHYYGTHYLRHGKRPSQLNAMDLMHYFGNKSNTKERLTLFNEVISKLEEDFGTWNLPWGDVNRYQRLNGDIYQKFDDNKPSIPIGFASGRWGALAAYGVSYSNNTKKIYGTRGNSFVAVVEFGDKVNAKSILAGGQSGNPESPHFDDQIELYANAEFKDVLFYKEDVIKHNIRTYHPGN